MDYTALVFNIVILAALAATIFYAHRLSRQFTGMQANKQAFEQLIGALNLASSRAEAAIKALKEAAVAGGDQLQDKINKARELSDELEIMVQAGDNLAGRLTGLAEGTRKSGGQNAEAPAIAGNDEPQPRIISEGAQPRAASENMPRTVSESAPPRIVSESAPPRTRAEKELLEALKAKQQS